MEVLNLLYQNAACCNFNEIILSYIFFVSFQCTIGDSRMVECYIG